MPTLTSSAAAQRSDNTIQVLGRALSFLVPPFSGSITVAIVYEPGNQASVAEAEAMQRALRSGIRAGGVTLRPRMVASNALAQLDGARVAFVTRGINYGRVSAAAGPRSILTVSSDRRCATSGQCVMSISSGGRIQILVSRAAARAANLRFNTSFLMLVTEV
ncbi:YfiR/HmsC family protein [Sphingosinicella terrae]|uniref:YfiR/HmsC family protein n=1 Tax=Sphingosinicella terrae TaxID=2172047 RepID=UPI0013B3C7C4|nr:YfiR/HmsC family protein [Sphingosinicella terrae]